MTVETLANAQLRSRVEHLVCHGAPIEVVQALRAGPRGADVLTDGFGGPLEAPEERVTFAAFCLRRGRVDVWRAVVEANITDAVDQRGSLWSTIRRRYVECSMTAGGTATSPHEAAVVAASPEGLAYALEVDSSPNGLTTTFGADGLALHAFAVERLMLARFQSMRFSSAGGPAEDLRGALRCCDLLRKANAPWGAGGASGVMDSFVGGQWPGDLDFHADIEALVGRYAGAGMLDLASPMDPGHPTSMTPLAAAASYLCTPAVVALIRLGAPIETAVPPGHPAPDLVSYIASQRRDGAEACASAAREALMRLHLSRAAGASQRQPPPPVARRAARAGL